MKKRIYFFACFGDWDKVPYGGGEQGNRRTLQLMRNAGYEVTTISKYTKVYIENKVLLVIVVFSKMLWCLLKLFWVLLWGRRKNSIVHIGGIYYTMVYFELALVTMSKFLGYRTIYEMRGGGAREYYDTGSKLYRYTFDKIIKRCDCVFSQGLENYELIDSIVPNKDKYYYPNYVMPDFYPKVYPQKEIHPLKLLYFGRISKTKNVDLILEATKIIEEEIKDVGLEIVGNFVEPNYKDELYEQVEKLGLKNIVTFKPACSHDSLRDILKEKTFYLFPTSETHEGHSNAVTEAMAWGVIPIATPQGFNRSVISNSSLIVEELTAKAFADRVIHIVETEQVINLSQAMYDRCMKLYTAETAYVSLKKEYDSLFESYHNIKD